MIRNTRSVSIVSTLAAARLLWLAGVLASLLSCQGLGNRVPWILVPDNGTVWQVWADGKIVRLPHSFMVMKKNSGMYFSVFPKSSPDQRRVAFVQDNDLWVYEIKTKTAKKLTSVGKPKDERYASVFVDISTWSPDSTRILYHVIGGVTEPMGDAVGPTVKERAAPYGMHIYDLGRGSSHAVTIGGRLAPVWLPDDDFLVIRRGRTSSNTNNVLHKYNADTRRSTPVTKASGWYGRPVLGPKAQWIVVSAGQKPSGELLSQLWKIDLNTGEVTHITPLGRWTEYQAPAVSPTGRIAYNWERTRDPRDPEGTIVVDGRELYPHIGFARVFWINDEAIAVLARKELVVLDVSTGQIKQRQLR